MGVGGMAVMMVLACKNTFVLLPASAQEWITEFDWGGHVGPFEFEFYLPGHEQETSRKANHLTPKRCPGLKVLSPPQVPVRLASFTQVANIGFTPRLLPKSERCHSESQDEELVTTE